MTELQPGDLLLYKPNGLMGRLISWRTSGKYSHCELYIGGGRSISARNEGVNEFHYRADFALVLRPTEPFDLKSALAWFEKEAKGQAYDWLGILWWVYAKHYGNRLKAQFCSEICHRLYAKGGFYPFAAHIDSDTVSPSHFEWARNLAIVTV